MGIGIIIAVIVVLGIMLMSSYNGFVNSEENVDQSYAQIETQLQRRLGFNSKPCEYGKRVCFT